MILTVGYSTGNRTVTGPVVDGGLLLTPADRGKFIDLIFHGKFSTSPGANDGIIRSWVRKKNQPAYIAFHNITDARLDKPSAVPASEQFWKRGYLMGWSNSGFDQETTFHLSQIEYYQSRPPARPAAANNRERNTEKAAAHEKAGNKLQWGTMGADGWEKERQKAREPERGSCTCRRYFFFF